MDVNGIPLFEFLHLPFEIQCHIISHITEYRDILRLRLVSPYMRLLLPATAGGNQKNVFKM